MNTRRLTKAIADPYAATSLSARARSRRWAELLRRFPKFERMRVIDLGGDARHWEGAPVMPKSLTLLNLFPQESPAADVDVVVGSACDPPAEIAQRAFDFVYSNSVIEHVGGFGQQRAFANTVARLAPHHWIQTPYRYFPLEPHWLFPGFQFLPVPARVAVTRLWPLGHRRARDRTSAGANTLSVQLLTKTEMRFLFPESDLWDERLGGLTKSLVAVR